MQVAMGVGMVQTPVAHGNGVIAQGGGHALVECLGRAWHHERGAWGLVLPTSH